jgi:hypothetical protein
VNYLVDPHGVRLGGNRKVIILTAFDHLAERDEINMRDLYQKFGLRSLFVTSKVSSTYSFSTADVIYADSQQLLDLVRSNAAKENPQSDLMEFALGSWEHFLILIDEADVLLQKDEHYFVNDLFWLFGKDSDPTSVATTLSTGKYKAINELLGVHESVKTELTRQEKNEKVEMDQAGRRIHYCDSFGKQLDQSTLRLRSIGFSLKSKMRSYPHNCLGLSGTIDPGSFSLNVKKILGIEPKVPKIPLFFSPHKQHGDLECRCCYADDKQIEWLPLAVSRSEIPVMSHVLPALQTKDQWRAAIEADVKLALEQNQAVLIFAADDNKDNNDFVELSSSSDSCRLRSLGVFTTYDSNFDPQDEAMQKIATPGSVSLCCKRAGRGADIRVPPSMVSGLHVIVASPDYMEEILQQVGRTGRMNRRGSYSFIFHSGATIPPYPDSDTSDHIRLGQFIERLSTMFFLEGGVYQNRSEEQRKYFLWLLEVVASYGVAMIYFNRAYRGEDAIAQKEKEIEEHLNLIIRGTK